MSGLFEALFGESVGSIANSVRHCPMCDWIGKGDDHECPRTDKPAGLQSFYYCTCGAIRTYLPCACRECGSP